jgi:hypothetical protein
MEIRKRGRPRKVVTQTKVENQPILVVAPNKEMTEEELKKEKLRAYRREYFRKNKEKYNKRQNEKYHEKRRLEREGKLKTAPEELEKRRIKSKNYYKKNPETFKEYYKNNKEKILAECRARYQKKIANQKGSKIHVCPTCGKMNKTSINPAAQIDETPESDSVE